MQAASDTLVRELMQAESALNKIARRLEEEFQERFQSAGVDPLSLVKRVQRLQTELPELRADCQALIQRKQELIDAAKQQLGGNRSKLHHLCVASGMPPPDDAQIHDAYKEAISEWDAHQVATRSAGALEPALNRSELNAALAGSMLQ